MNRDALTAILVGAIAVLVATLAPPGGAAAQPQPTLVLSPSSGPCDAEIQVSGSGFPVPNRAYPFVTTYLVQPGSADVNMGGLTRTSVGEDGTLSEWPALLGGCQAAALDSHAEQPTGHLVIAATLSDALVTPGARIPDIIATAQYAYTTTAPPSQLTMVLSPSSGPCDQLVKVMGRGFPLVPQTGRIQGVYLLRPGTTDVSMGLLTDGIVNQDGAFSEWFSLYERGCEAATLDSQAEHPTGYLAVAATPQHLTPGPGLQPGEHIPNIIAVAQYRYTTTTPPPPPVMAISPSSGPCDGTVEITGRDFPASTAIHLDVAGGGGETTLGKVVPLTTDSSGGFAVSASLGTLGCEAAQSMEGLGEGPHELWIFASRDVPLTVPGQTGGPPLLTRSAYAYTTTVPAAPQALPSTGDGPTQGSTRWRWLLLAGGLAGAGFLLAAGLGYRSRKLRR